MYKKHILYCRPGEKLFNWENTGRIRSLPVYLEDYGRVKVTFEKYIPMKSLSQLGYYRAGILPFLESCLFDDTGITQAQWHEVLKEKFGIRVKDKSGLFEIIKSHAEYTESEMQFFIKQVKDWVLHFFQFEVPPPKIIDEYV